MYRLAPMLLILICIAQPSYAQDFVEDFEAGVGTAASYHKATNEATIEIGAENAFSGQHYVRATTAGQRNLEGFAVRATGSQAPAWPRSPHRSGERANSGCA